MNRDVVLQSCFDAACCLCPDLPREEQGLQLDLAGYIDIFKKAVSNEVIGDSEFKIDDALLTKISVNIQVLGTSDSPLKTASPKTWNGIRALMPAVNSYLDFEAF